jgi:uncharacterized DUF497 family protein
MKQITYLFDPEKNKQLKEKRGVNFEDVILAIEQGYLLDVRQQHHNSIKYPNQKIIIVKIDNYAYQVPFVQEEDTIILKTVYASRKATAFYLKKDRKKYEN